MKVSGKAISICCIIAAAIVISLSASAADTMKIGATGAHSGGLASYGLPTVKAAEMIVNEINAKGGINGKKVELLVEQNANIALKITDCGYVLENGHIVMHVKSSALLENQDIQKAYLGI